LWRKADFRPPGFTRSEILPERQILHYVTVLVIGVSKWDVLPAATILERLIRIARRCLMVRKILSNAM